MKNLFFSLHFSLARTTITCKYVMNLSASPLTLNLPECDSNNQTEHCLLGPQVGGEITSLSGCRNDPKRKTRLDKNRFDYSPPYDLSTAAEMNITFG